MHVNSDKAADVLLTAGYTWVSESGKQQWVGHAVLDCPLQSCGTGYVHLCSSHATWCKLRSADRVRYTAAIRPSKLQQQPGWATLSQAVISFSIYRQLTTR